MSMKGTEGTAKHHILAVGSLENKELCIGRRLARHIAF